MICVECPEKTKVVMQRVILPTQILNLRRGSDRWRVVLCVSLWALFEPILAAFETKPLRSSWCYILKSAIDDDAQRSAPIFFCGTL